MKECQICKTKETPQWYSGPTCKSCYRKQHRKNNIQSYKSRDRKNYEQNKERILERQLKYYEEHKEECKERSKANYYRRGTLRKEKDYLKQYYRKNKKHIDLG